MSEACELPEVLMHDRSIIIVHDMITKPDLNRRETSSTASVQTNDPSETREARFQRRLKHRTIADLEDKSRNSVEYETKHEAEHSSEAPNKDSNARSANRPTYKKPKKKARAPRKTAKSNTRPRHEAFFNAQVDYPVTDDDEPLSELRSKRESSESTAESQLSRIPWSTGGSVVDKMKGLMIYPSEPCEAVTVGCAGEDRGPFTSRRVRECAITDLSSQPLSSIGRKRQQAGGGVRGHMAAKGALNIPPTPAAGAAEGGVALALDENKSPLPNRSQKVPIHASTPPALTVASGFPGSDRHTGPTLDDRAYDMLKHIISLARQPNEWVDFLGPNDYEITSGEETVLSAGHKNVEGFMRAALFKIDDEVTKTYSARSINYQNVSVTFHAHNIPCPTRVTDVWKPFSDLHSIVRKNHTSIAHYASELQSLWRNIVKRTPHLTLPLTPSRRITPTPPRSISFVLLLVVTCAPRSDLQAALEEQAPHSDQSNAIQDYISDGLKALRHEHPLYKGVSTLELTAIWARLNNMIQAACQDGIADRGADADSRATARENRRPCESRWGTETSARRGKKRKAGEFERGGMQSDAVKKT